MIGGKLSSWKHGTNGAPTTLTDFSTKTFSVDPTFEAETVDVTTFQQTYRQKEQSYKNASIETVYKWDATIDGQLWDIYNNSTAVDFDLGVNGTAAGQPSRTGSAFITNVGTPTTVGDRIEMRVSWEVTGAVTRGVYS